MRQSFSTPVISPMESIGGQMGSQRRAKANGSAVPSVGDQDWDNSQGRPGLLLESVWHPMQSY